MFGQIFGDSEVMSSMILGGATVSAAALNVLNEARKARRVAKETGSTKGRLRRPVVLLAMSALGVGMWLTYATTGALRAQGISAPRAAMRKLSDKMAPAKNPDAAKRPSSKPAASTPAVAAVAVSTAPAARLEEWLQAEGTKLYYRYEKYLPDACPGTPVAIGNWADGEVRPVEARCVEGGWLALDVGPLVADGRIVPNMTYCLNFRAANGAWGLHVPERAPGIDSVAVPAIRVPLGRAIGLRYLPGTPRERVVPTSASPRAAC